MNDRFDVELQMVNNKEVTQVNKIKESPGNDVTALGTVGARQNQRTWVLFSFGGGGDDDGDDDDDEEEDRYYLGTLLLLLATEVYCACVGSWDGLIYTGAMHYHRFAEINKTHRYLNAFFGLAIWIALSVLMFLFDVTKTFPYNYIILIIAMASGAMLMLGLVYISYIFCIAAIFKSTVIFLIFIIFEQWNALIRPLQFNYVRWFILYPIGIIPFALCIIISNDIEYLGGVLRKEQGPQYTSVEQFCLPIIVFVHSFAFLLEFQLIDYGMIDTSKYNFAVTFTLLLTSVVNLPLYLVRIFRSERDE